MTALKIDSKLSVGANEALAPHAGQLFARLGSSRLAMIELRSVERAEPAPDEDKEQAVKVRVVQLEVANPEQEETLRQVLSALHLHRTAYGTLNEEGDLQLSESTLERAAGEVNAVEAARLHVAIERWTEYGHRVLSRNKTTASELRQEFDTVIKGLMAAVTPSALFDR